MTIGELLKEERIKKGLTQKQFADGIVSVSYYSKVEKKRTSYYSITMAVMGVLVSCGAAFGSMFGQQLFRNVSAFTMTIVAGGLSFLTTLATLAALTNYLAFPLETDFLRNSHLIYRKNCFTEI